MQVRVFRRANRGFAASNNVALDEARGRYVLLLNPDVEIRSGTLGELVAAMDARAGARHGERHSARHRWRAPALDKALPLARSEPRRGAVRGILADPPRRFRSSRRDPRGTSARAAPSGSSAPS